MKKVNTKFMVVTFIAIALFATSLGGSFAQEKNTIDLLTTYGHVYDENNLECMRPRIMGTKGVVSTGHYLSTMAGIDVFKKGGNAFDAGVAAAMALKVMKMGYAGWAGVAPLVLYSAREGIVTTRIGAGPAPAKATLDNYLEYGKSWANEHSVIVPADIDVWLATLDRFGTLSFEEAIQYAIDIAENGYHLYKMQKWLLDSHEEKIMRWPYNVEFWFQMGVGKQKVGDLMTNKDQAKLMRYMVAAERRALAAGGTRSDGIWAARDAFYKGEPAKAVDKFFEENVHGIMTYEDFANYRGDWMPPVHTNFMGYDVYGCDGWSQGPRMILFLNMLKEFDLKALGYNTPEYIHVISQVINLGISDCHRYIGDPLVVDIPKELYSQEYARERVKLIDMEKAFQDMPPWGDPRKMLNIAEDSPKTFALKDAPLRLAMTNNFTDQMDTTSLNVMDADGNIFSMTESDTHMDTPLIPGWGFGLGARGAQFNLDPTLNNVVAPFKIPRNTNNPWLAMKDGKPFMGFSTPGGDQQAQALLQVFLNVVLWGMEPQAALDQPRFGSYNFPGTGSESNSNPAALSLEDRIPKETFEALKKMGHDVRSWGGWNYRSCAPTLTYRDPETGILIAASDVRREAYSLGY